ncbi:MAG: hypothetical protein JWR09_1488 [Mucilaginibacter sp.]|nr:hypothetical protein [Mucilaginibacter sp.]
MTNSSRKLKRNSAKIYNEISKQSKLTQEIAKALIEVKLIQEGKIKPLSLKDI